MGGCAYIVVQVVLTIGTTTINTFGGYPIFDPALETDNRNRFRREALPLLKRALSISIPTGCLPVRGWVLQRRADYDLIDNYSTSLQLEVGDTSATNNVGTMSGLAIVQAQCVTTGVSSDPNALYLVEITDARGVLHNKWSQWPLVAKYNVRSPAYPQNFYLDSMDAVTSHPSVIPWTWSTMLRNIWEQMPLLGAWPTLPSTPAGVPEGFWFSGVPAWTTLCDILDYLGMTVACDLTQAAPYTIVSMGASDSALSILQGTYRGRLEDDQEWIDVGAGRVPGMVTVLFKRRNALYGTEETVRRDQFQWSTSSIHGVSITAPVQFEDAVGEHHIWSDFTIRYDEDGTLNTEDVATAQQIAEERVTQYFNRIYNGSTGFMSQVYAGALPFATGSQVSGVKWWYDGRERFGWRTMIVRGTNLPHCEG